MKFRISDHTYWQGKKQIHSVTEIIGKASLGRDWTGYNRAALRGTNVHRATALFDLGILDESSLTAEIAGYLEGWKTFRRDKEVVMQDIEKPMYCEVYDFAGTPDRFCWYEGEPMLLSIKSGTYERTHIVQEAGYSYFYPYPKLLSWGIYLSADGKYRVVNMKEHPTEFIYARQVFLAALTVIRWKENK